MARGDGSLWKRGGIYYFCHWESGVQHKHSTGCRKLSEARSWRDRFLKRQVGTPTDKITCGELLDDVLRHVEATGKASTARVWKWVVEANLRPFFGERRVHQISTERLREYREARIREGRTPSTANRELSILRTAFHLGRKSTPPKVASVPYFPMVSEAGRARQGFLTDEQYTALRDALPDYLKPLFVVAYFTGIRKGELLTIRVNQVDMARGYITLMSHETKADTARSVPIFEGDMCHWVGFSIQGRGQDDLLFHNQGQAVRDFRGAWETAVKAAGVPDLKFHDLRRTAVRNLRRAGVPQVVRMKISGHKTTSMEQRYNIVDTDDLEVAKTLMAARSKPETKSA